MQTFLPYENFDLCGTVLDRRRLNKQILETRQIMNVLYKKANSLPTAGWVNHPAVLMWEGYEWALFKYGQDIRSAWGKPHKAFTNMNLEHGTWILGRRLGEFPPWLGDEDLHSSHRARLLHKGTLDVLSSMINIRKIRDLTVEDVKLVCSDINVSYETLLLSSHYHQFKWDEEPSDNYVWPI